MTEDPAKQAWQASVEIAGAPPLEEVRRGARKFYRYIWWRNAIEYVACVIVVVSFASYVLWAPNVLQKVGSVLIVLAAFYAGWQLHRRASALAPEEAGLMPLLLFARMQMVRQRDALRGLFWWYVLPFLPGMVLVVIGNGSAKTGETSAVVAPGWPEWLFMATFGAFVAGICWLNRHFATKLQRHIDEIDALTGGAE